MNIFFLDTDPWLAASYHCDSHIRKMIVETAQLLSAAHHLWDGTSYTKTLKSGKTKTYFVSDKPGLYKPTHINHPSSIWCRENISNYKYLFEIFKGLCCHYSMGTGKVHATYAATYSSLKNAPANIPDGDLTIPPCAMLDEFKVHVSPTTLEQVVENYRNYYNESKSRFATFGKYNNPTPDWYHGKAKL